MYTKIVERIHDTKPQKQLSPGERKNNLKKAFRGNLKEYQKAGMPKRVLVIDDIYTTGSTAEAVTTALKQLGVQRSLCILHSDRKRIFLIFPSWCFMYWFVIIGAGIFVEGYYLERGK